MLESIPVTQSSSSLFVQRLAGVAFATALLPALLLAALTAAGCGGNDSPMRPRGDRDGGELPDAAPPPPPEDADSPRDTSPPRDTGEPPTDAGPASEANIREVLRCAMPAGVSGTGRAGELQLQEISAAEFPDALCNDGTPPVMRYRPYRGEENRNRWVISLRGGGACGGAESCAARWCGCSDANPCDYSDMTSIFNANNMSGGGARSSDTEGVLRRDGDPNPVQDYNHVELVYCSSDSWAGRSRGVTYTTIHPRTGVEVTYTLHFLGERIFDAGISILRQDGADALAYTLDGGSVPLPDLDEATQVLFEGDSAGGAGVIHHLDNLRNILREHHAGGGGGPEIVGLIDAIVGPDRSRLDWSETAGAALGIDTYAEAMDYVATIPTRSAAYHEDSCETWHMAHAPETVSACLDEMHLVRHHITTPFFVRMALLDGLISQSYAEMGLRDPELGSFEPVAVGGSGARLPVTFGRVLQRELAAFPMLPMTAEEGADMTRGPGVFAPACSKHDTIHDDPEVYGVTITPPGTTTPLRLFDVLGNWTQMLEPSAVLTMDEMRRDTVCR